MPALRKPYRIAVLLPILDGEDAQLLIWMALIETLQRHPGLAVYDPESTPLRRHDGHYAPEHAASATDPFWETTRRDELLWLEAPLGGTGPVRLHTTKGSFDALGRRLGDQIDQVIGAWLLARGLPPLPRRFEAATAEDVLAAVRALAPALAEGKPRPAKGALRVAALRIQALALDEDLTEQILAIDPEHPQSLLAKDPLNAARALAASPGYARAYDELPGDGLVAMAGAGIAALCRPGQLEVLEDAANRLAGDGRIDEAIRLMERAVLLHTDDPQAHLGLLALLAQADRPGAWLAQAQASARLHGCPMDPDLPWYPDQIKIDLAVSDALMEVGRLDEAIALRANRLEGREEDWPRHTEILKRWRRDPRFVAWSYAREGAFRGDDARAVEGFGRVEPGASGRTPASSAAEGQRGSIDSIDIALFLDALVATGREADAPLAWAQFGTKSPVARLAAARALIIAGEYRRGLEELWRAELAAPDRDEHTAIARIGALLAMVPLEVAESALAERIAVGAATLARRMARDLADFIPAAAGSSLVARALGKTTNLEFDAAWLNGFTRRPAIDALFAKPDMVERWLEVVYLDADALVESAAYCAAQALARYLAMTTQAPNPLAGALRTVAGEALALVRAHRDELKDRDARAILRAIEPVLRRADRWVTGTWLGTVERSCAIDEHSAGDVAGFAGDCTSVAARILGPEEAAVLAASVARLHAERPKNWAAAVSAQAQQLAMHTGTTGLDAWADAVIAELDTKDREADDAIDTLHVAAYLAEGVTAMPALRLAKILFSAGRAPAAVAVLNAGLPAATADERDRELPLLPWAGDIPRDFAKVSPQMFEALQKGDPLRAEKLGRWAVAYDPSNAEAHRNLGLALAQQGKVADALTHLVRATPEQATQILSGVLYQAGKLPEAMAVLDYASRWYVRADQWLTFGGIAYAAMDNPRTVRGYDLAWQLDPDAFDGTQLNAYAGVLDEVGESSKCEIVAKRLLELAGDDAMLRTSGWNHLACACIGLDRFDEAIELAQHAVDENPLPDNAQAFAATLARAQAGEKPLSLSQIGDVPREPIYALLESGDHAIAAAQLLDPSWKVKLAALGATRFRFASEDRVAVTDRARAASAQILSEARTAEAAPAKALALLIREQAYFAREPVPTLGDRMTRDAFYAEFRARGGVVLGDDAPPPVAFVDRLCVPGIALGRASEYIQLLRELAERTPQEALALFGLDAAGYLSLAKSWTQAMRDDPTIAPLIASGLAVRP